MALNFNTNPYYDDFDEDKNFHRILFRPGRAVQARELTQSQTILQNQIDRFGKHIFKEGSIVSGGETFDEDAISIKLQPTFGNTTIDISTYDGYYALANSSNAVYKIRKAEIADSVDPNTLLVKFIKTAGISSLNSNGSIANSETLRIFSTADLAPANLVGNVLTSSTESSTIGRVFSITEGVFFTNGIFVKNASQTVTISKYSNNANATVGFDVAETIVSSSSDSTLLDPAIGASNYIAPGADRYKVSLSLSAKEIDVNQSIPDLTSEKYIEIARYRNGELVKNVQKTEYSILEKTLARRTFDESGNYRVNGLEPRVAPERFTDAANTTFVLDISPGKAYVQGYEVEPISINSLIINKARDTETVSGYDVPAYYGNYFYVTTSNGAVINFSTAEKLELHRNTGAFGAATKIAEAYPKNLEYISGNGSTSVYKLHLFNIVKTSNTPIDLTRCIIAGNATSVNATCNIESSSTIVRTINGSNYSYSNVINLASSTGVTVGMEVSGANIVFPTYVIAINGNDITVNQNPVGNNSLGNTSLTFRSAFLTDTSYDSSVFEASYDVIKQFSQVNYNAKRVFKSVSFTAGVASVQTNDGTERFKDVSGANLQRNYAICIRTGGTGSFPNFTWVNLSAGSYISVPSPSVGSPATLNINLGDGTFNGTADILTTLDITAAVRRTKTLSSNNVKYFNVLDSANTFSLGYADVTDVSAIYIASGGNNAGNSNVNVVGSFDIDFGQKDSFYDHATIKLKTGASVNLGNTMVVFNRYTHSGTGFFDTQSYPSYNTIPSYTKTNGTIIDLRDSIDFRPIRTANVTSNVYSNLSMSFSSQQIVDSLIGSVDTDLEYYLGRTDKVVVKSDESFKVIEGVSAATNPPVPNDEVDAMTLCTLTIQPYTYEVGNVSLNIQNNRRYTMKDIGAIDNRLTKVEYYTALNLLEKDIATTTYYDDRDNQLFNNGFIVDPFKGHGIGDVFNPDYKCSIDFDNEILRPRFESNGTSLTIASNTLAVTSNLLTLTYTSVPYITQNVASGTTNVNPFNVIGFIGYVKLPKDTGTWVNFDKRPDVVVNKNKNLDNYTYSNNFIGSAWNNWSILGYPDDNIVVYTYYSTSGQEINSTTDGRIKTEDSGIVEDKIYVYSANNLINFELFGMRPNTEMTLYVDSRHIGSYLRVYEANSFGNIISVTANTNAVGPAATACTYTLALSGGGTNNTAAQIRVTTAATGAISTITILNPGLYNGAPVANTFGNTQFTITVAANTPGYTANSLVTNSSGYAKGQFTLPYDDNNKFVAGEKHLYFCDNRLSMENVTTFAETYFYTAFPKKKKKKKKKKKPVTNLTVIGGDPTVGPGIYIDSTAPTYTSSVSIGSVAAQNGTRLNGSSDFKSAVKDLTGSDWTPSDQATASSRANAANDVIVNLYKNELGRLPDQDGHNYWVSVAASGVSTEKLTEAFVAAAKANNEKCQQGDPLAQTFFVNEFTNPNGIFVSSIDLYFATKDTSGIPVEVELRPSVNGFPDSENVIPGSRVTLNPSQVNLPVTANTPVATRFTFDSPIYLEPDEYAFVVMAQSDAYNVYVGTVGQRRIDGTGPIVSQPYIGSFFKSQNASTWTPEQSTDIAFVLNKCEFTTNINQTAILTPVALGYDQLYDVAKVSIPFEAVAAAANVSFDLSTKNDGAGVLSNYVGIIPNRNISLDQRKTFNAATDANVKIRMITTDPDISPYVDVSSSNYILVKNLLESSASANVVSFPETLSSGGGALSKYITRKVTLNDGFDATSLRVYLQENLPQGSSTQVYYRVQAATDSDKLENKPWLLMTQTGASSTNQNPTEYYDYEYKVNGVSYTSGGVTYTNFRTFAIKIVLYSTNPANAPTAKNLRAIALS